MGLWLAELANRELRRPAAPHRHRDGSQASAPGSDAWNADPEPFVSTKTADEILDVLGVAIGAVTSGSACHHSGFIRTGLILQPTYSHAADLAAPARFRGNALSCRWEREEISRDLRQS